MAATSLPPLTSSPLSASQQPHGSGAAQSPHSRASVTNEITDTLPKLPQAGFCSSPKREMLWVFMQMTRWAHPSWELLHFSHTHISTRATRCPSLPPPPQGRLAVWWRCGGALGEGELLGDSEEKRAQPEEGLNLGGRKGRGANGAENTCWEKVGASRECDFTE